MLLFGHFRLKSFCEGKSNGIWLKKIFFKANDMEFGPKKTYLEKMPWNSVQNSFFLSKRRGYWIGKSFLREKQQRMG